MATEEKKARRIAVISGKGGVGKTVITANLAAAWTSIGRRILVVDADLGLANIDILLGVDPPFTIQDTFRGTRTLEEVLVHTNKGFDLLPAGSGLPEGTAFTTTLAENMTSILDALDSRYDAILFDVGAGVGDVVLYFAGLAHEILLVSTPEPTAMMDAYATIKIVSQQCGRNEFLLVVNQINPFRAGQIGSAVANHLQNVISKFLQSKDQGPVRIELVGSIPLDSAVQQAIRQRRLVAETNPRAPSAGLMNTLAAFFDTRMQAIP
jgi:flagellar biosynthesis protein FlhG